MCVLALPPAGTEFQLEPVHAWQLHYPALQNRQKCPLAEAAPTDLWMTLIRAL